jgi:hypothetical protein
VLLDVANAVDLGNRDPEGDARPDKVQRTKAPFGLLPTPPLGRSSNGMDGARLIYLGLGIPFEIPSVAP